MKKRLLITLGCSWTEGHGASSRHEFGWPKLLGTKLGFDKIYNFGKGGDSNSGQVKRFYEYIYYNDLSQYEVLVIFMMTDPARFSFYVESKVESYLVNTNNLNEMERAYLNTIPNVDIDPTLEQLFYVRTLEQVCNSKNFSLLLCTWVSNYDAFFNLYKTPNNQLFPRIQRVFPPRDKFNSKFIYFAPCGHPNNLGYEWITNEMYNAMKLKHSKWCGVSNPNIEYEFYGEMKREWHSTKSIL